MSWRCSKNSHQMFRVEVLDAAVEEPEVPRRLAVHRLRRGGRRFGNAVLCRGQRQGILTDAVALHQSRWKRAFNVYAALIQRAICSVERTAVAQ